MRHLATVQKISKVIPIEGRDRIEQAFINGWSIIVGKGEFKEGDLCVFFEIDSMLPKIDQFEPVNKRGNRVKTMKLGKTLSQGFAINIETAKCAACALNMRFPEEYDVGTNLTEVLNVIKWEPESFQPKISKRKPKSFWEWIWRTITLKFHRPESTEFPTELVPKSDEERVENLIESTIPYYSDSKMKFKRTVKMDGASTTWILFDDRSGWISKRVEMMCTRNRRVTKESDDYEYMKRISEKTQVFFALEKLLFRLQYDYQMNHDIGICDTNVEYIAFQAELCGPKIQKNEMHLDTEKLFVYTVYVKTRSKFHKMDPRVFEKFINGENEYLRIVPYIGESTIPKTIDEFYKDCVCYYDTIESETADHKLGHILAEGVVYRNYDKDVSFKCVNPDYLLKHKL